MTVSTSTAPPLSAPTTAPHRANKVVHQKTSNKTCVPLTFLVRFCCFLFFSFATFDPPPPSLPSIHPLVLLGERLRRRSYPSQARGGSASFLQASRFGAASFIFFFFLLEAMRVSVDITSFLGDQKGKGGEEHYFYYFSAAETKRILRCEPRLTQPYFLCLLRRRRRRCAGFLPAAARASTAAESLSELYGVSTCSPASPALFILYLLHNYPPRSHKGRRYRTHQPENLNEPVFLDC